MELLTALTIGFLGSFHCIGMCGPIALALPVPKSSNFIFFSGRILYNSGRIISYALLGLLFGFLGKGFVTWGYQQSLSIALGVIILILLFIPVKYKNKFLGMNIILKITEPLKKMIGNLFKRDSLPSFLLIRIFKRVSSLRIRLHWSGRGNSNRLTINRDVFYDIIWIRNVPGNACSFTFR